MDVTTDKLMHDLKNVVGDAEDLLKATASQSGEHIARIRRARRVLFWAVRLVPLYSLLRGK